MTVQYTIQLTDAQNKALRYDAVSAQDWIENVVYEKCRVMIEEIVMQEVNRITANGGAISGTKEEIVLAAPIVLASDRIAQSGNQV
jgi:hypothetical protein